MEIIEKKYKEINTANSESFAHDVSELKKEAQDALRSADINKKDQFSWWRDFISKIFIAWFVLITADTITGTHLIAKYLVLVGGIYLTWNSLIYISLFGQRASFASHAIKHVNHLLKRKFDFLSLSESCFVDNNGVTKYYKSTTSTQIVQHKNILVILIIAIFISLGQDLFSFI